LQELEPSGATLSTPVVAASSHVDTRHAIASILDNNQQTQWRSAAQPEQQEIRLDLGKNHEYGGLVIDWDAKDFARQYNVLVSTDGNNWEKVYAVTKGKGGRSYIYLKDQESHHIKLELLASARKQGYAINELAMKANSFSENPEAFFAQVARDVPRGYFPKYLQQEQSYILINRDRAGIQPGSRAYERSWIRDGALTSAALLRFGVHQEVRDYIDWYASHQYPNGKVPCVVDTRGADPVPENDRHGEFSYAILQYFHFTKDTLWLRQKFPHVVKAVEYIEYLRNQRKTEVYMNGTPEQRACYGLLPESISHEGYSAKPMHSYWDDFFGVKGLKDATAIAEILGERQSRSSAIRLKSIINISRSAATTKSHGVIKRLTKCATLALFFCSDKRSAATSC